jgi:hypothetical protein
VSGIRARVAKSDTSTTSPNSRLPMQRAGWISWISALGCQGHGMLELLLASPGLPAFLPVVYAVVPPSTDPPGAFCVISPAAVFFTPPVPPPRLFYA